MLVSVCRPFCACAAQFSLLASRVITPLGPLTIGTPLMAFGPKFLPRVRPVPKDRRTTASGRYRPAGRRFARTRRWAATRPWRRQTA